MTFDQIAGSKRLFLGALVTLCLLLLAPLLVVDMPPLVDYPNHLARVTVLAALPGDPVIARFYATRWAVIPNLALDLIGPPLLRVLPVHVAGRVLIGMSVLMPVLGCVAYGAAQGRRSWWSLGVGLVAYNRTLLEGFLNFNMGIGLALLLAAAWTRWRRQYPTLMIVVAALGAVALFVCHLMALLMFGVLIAADELVRIWSLGMRPRVVLASGARLALIFAAPLALYACSGLPGLGDDAIFLGAGAKLNQLLAAFMNYVGPLDALTALFALAAPTLCLLLRRGHMRPPVRVAAVVMLGAYLAAPYGWKGTFQIDTRFAIMLGVLLFAGFIPARWPVWLRGGATIVVVALLLARMAVLTAAWSAHRADLADLRAALAPVRPGQAVYVVLARPDDPAAYQAHAPLSRHLSDGGYTGSHLAALALIEHRAWWPYEFDNASQQPIRTLEPYQSMALRVGDLPGQDGLASADLCGWDVVLVLQADAAPPLPAGRFQPLAGQGFARSYAIKSCQPPAP